MKLTTSTAPSECVVRVARALDELGTDGVFCAELAQARLVGVEASFFHRFYEIESAAGGPDRWRSKQTGWRCLLSSVARPRKAIAIAHLDTLEHGLSIHWGEMTESLVSAVSIAAEYTGPTEEFEICVLRCYRVHVIALWLQSTNGNTLADRIVPMDRLAAAPARVGLSGVMTTEDFERNLRRV